MKQRLKTFLSKLFSDKPALLEWLQQMIGHPIYESICWNIARENKAQIYPPDVLDFYFAYLEEFIKKSKKSMDKEILKNPYTVIEQTLDSIPEFKIGGRYCLCNKDVRGVDVECTSSKYCFHSSQEAPPIDQNLCRFEHLTAFHRYSLGRNSIPYADALHYAREVEQRKHKPLTQLKGERQFCWVTPKDKLGRIFDERDSNSAVTVLGLSRFPPSEHLVITVYPKTFRLVKLAKPSFLEGVMLPFRVDLSGNKWGKAVNLENGEDGLPEAVHCPHFRTSDFEYFVWTQPSGVKKDYSAISRKLKFNI